MVPGVNENVLPSPDVAMDDDASLMPGDGTIGTWNHVHLHNVPLREDFPLYVSSIYRDNVRRLLLCRDVWRLAAVDADSREGLPSTPATETELPSPTLTCVRVCVFVCGLSGLGAAVHETKDPRYQRIRFSLD